MLSTESAILRIRRDLILGALVKGLLLSTVVASVLVLPRVVPQAHAGLVMLAAGAAWVGLGYRSAKAARESADAPGLIAAGRFDEAEERIDASVRAFSLFRAAKLQSLQQLAALRHAQKRYAEAADVCRAIFRQRDGRAGPLARPVRLLMADAMLELNDVRGAYEALSGLQGQPMSLAEVLDLLSAQLDYESRIGAWDRVMHEPMTKVRLVELMPAATAARAQAFMALAAGRIGRDDFRRWLRARAELLADPKDLVADRPMLAEVWAGG